MTSILEFVVPIVLLIILHEFGHFIAAKAFGIEVEEFGLGFPPRAMTLFEWAGTKYTLNWIPLGGFVRPKGENDPTIKGGLAAANPWVRIAVFAAGPLANLLTAALLFGVVFMQIGSPDPARILITSVDPNSPAETAGFLPGDILTQINENVIDSDGVLIEQVALNIGQEMAVTLERDAEIVELNMVPRENPPEGEGAMGIHFSHPTVQVGFFGAFARGTGAVVDYMRLILTIPARLFEGSIAPEDARLLGYKGMFDLYQNVKTFETPPGVSSTINPLAFFATISVSLGLFNLFPIPAVDGGRIMFGLPEIIFRRRIPPNYENVINFVSFSLLILLMIYINIQDIVNPVQF